MPIAARRIHGLIERLFRRIKTKEVNWINAEVLNSQISNGKVLTILDVRGGDEFVGPLGHIPSSLNIPLGELPQRLTEITTRIDQPFILVCKTDKRSAQAAKLLREASFQDIHVLRGGMDQWNRNGFETESRTMASDNIYGL